MGGGPGPGLNMYTSPNAGTPQGQQLDQTNSAMMNLANGQPLSPQQVQGVGNQVTTGTAQLAQAQTPQFRSGYVNNGDLPAISQNYEDMARKLFNTDQAIAASGHYNSTPAPDATNVPGVGASPLELTPDALMSNTFQASNPGVGMQMQQAQQSSIADLLGLINNAYSKELTSRKGSYASSTAGQQSAIDSALKILGLNTDLVKSMNSSKTGSLSRDIDREKAEIAKRIAGSGQIGADGKLSPKAYQSAKQMAMSEYGWSPQDFDSEFNSFVNQTHVEDYGVVSTAGEEKTQKATADKQAAAEKLSGNADEIYKNWKNMGLLEKGIGTVPGMNKVGLLAPNMVKNDSIFYNNIIDSLRAKIGGRLTQQDIKWLHDQIPTQYDSDETATYKIQQLKGGLAAKTANPDANLSTTGNGTTLMRGPDGRTWNIPNDKVQAALARGAKPI